jgi:hypothetical protein
MSTNATLQMVTVDFTVLFDQGTPQRRRASWLLARLALGGKGGVGVM